ncbi:MAG: 4-hydroxy-tetrahydrodipicolinate reductase [Candidatus Omnitrophica bacterium]|nr:4-hydroxy-tetrahydrodipicolinate reductase [Candidatus Omnitrophota bacterium]
MITKIIVAGAAGRMGQRIIALAAEDKEVNIAGVFEAKSHRNAGRSLKELLYVNVDLKIENNLSGVIKGGEVVIDFTNPESTMDNLKVSLSAKKGMVIGTTGFAETQIKTIREAARHIPIVQSPNMSLGVNLLFRLVELAAAKLPVEYDVEITETHHRYKKDAPSGTAMELARRIAEARKRTLEQVVLYGRHGMTGDRKEGTIGIHALRGGDVVGEHVVSFLSAGERIEFAHKASSRDAFAKGAILAAKFIARKKSGFYTMQDVLGLK